MNVFACSKLFRKLLSVLILPTALILFTTCEVGLGASVDTQPPELTLDYPAGNNLAIMNSFTLSGKAKDETYVGSVEIKLTCNEGLRKGTTYGPFAAKLSENVGDGNAQTWSVLVNEPVIAEDGTRTYPIPDGSYTVSVTAYDSVKRSTSLSRVYNIDNTPPVVVLKRPIKSDSFGQVVKVTGDISDSNALKVLYFTAYKKDSSGVLKEVATVKKSNISGVGLEQIIAKKIQNPSNAEETELNDAYNALYDKDGTLLQDVFFKIEVSDAAEEYNPKTPIREGAAAEKKGNISDGYYIYKDIYSRIYSESGEQLTNSELVDIFNGEYANKEKAADVLEYLKNNIIKTTGEVTEAQTPKFSLSPKNSPMFEASGWKYGGSPASFAEISNGSKITVTVSPGRDQFQLDSDTVRLVLDECSATGVLTHSGAAQKENEIVLVESQENINAETNATKKAAMQAVRDSAFTEGDNIRITVAIGNRASNRYYIIRVDGKDIENHSIEPSDGATYGFKVLPTGVPPSIKITGGAEDNKKQSTLAANYSGNIKVSSSGIAQFYYTVTGEASDGTGTKIASHQIPITPLPVAPDFNWSVNVPAGTQLFNLDAHGAITTAQATIDSNKVYVYTVSFTADDTDGNRSTGAERRIFVDTKNPLFDTSTQLKAKAGSDAEVNMESPAFASKWFTRNEITITGKAKDFDGGDNEVNKVKSYGLKIGANAELPFPTTNDTGNFSLLASYAEGINHLELSVYDLAGNKTTKTFDVKVDNTAPILTSAEIVGNNITKENAITVKVIASDEKPSIAVSGLSKILIGKTSNFAESAALANFPVSGAAPYTVSVNIPASDFNDGSHTFYVRVIDNAGLVSEEKAVGFIVDRTPPAIAYTSHADNASVNKIIDLGGTITDANIASSSEIKLFRRVNNPAGAWVEFPGGTKTINASTTPATWKITDINTALLTDNTKYDFQVRVTDKAGNTTPDNAAHRTLLIYQNGDRPVVTFDTIKTSGLSTLGGKSINFSVEDDDGAVASVKVQVVKDGGGDPYKPDDASKWVDANYNHVTNKWSYEIPVVPPAKADGKYKIYFYIKDAKNEEFKTKEDGTDGLQVPYMKDTTATLPVYAPVAFSVDTEAPTIDSVEVQFDGDSTYYPLSNGQKYGGKTNKKARFRIKAHDTVTSDLNVMLEIQNFNAAEPTSLICSKTLGNGDPKKIESKSGGYYETAGLIDFGNVTVSGMKQISVTVKDNAEQSFSLSRTVTVDNAPPDSIKNVTPRPTDEVTGEVIMNGLVEDDAYATSGIPPENAMKYYIPKFSERDAAANTISESSWKTAGLTQNSISWKLTLNNLTAYTSDTLYSGYQTSAGSGLYQLPVWFRVEDTVGNVGYIKGNEIKYNPDADKPRAVITYPVANVEGTTSGHVYNYVVLGGTVSFTGSASDNEGIDSVWLQFDMDGDGDFDNDDITRLSGISGVNVQTIPCTSPAQQGVKATGTVSWSYKLEVRNLTGLSYTENDGNQSGKTLGVRAIAVDNDTSTANSQLAGAWSEILHVSVNNSVPTIDTPKLVRYSNSAHSGTDVQELGYGNDVYISKENWCLEGEVYDNDGIKEINVSGSQTGTHKIGGLGTQEGWFTKKNSDDEKAYTYKIPINKNDGKWEIELEVYDDDGANSKSSTAKYTINIDNTPPEFKDGADKDTLVLYKNEYGNSSPKLDSNENFMRDSNGWFTIASKAGEAGSGFERAVFYALRNGTTEKRVYNVMEEHGDNRMANRTEIETKGNNKVYLNDEHLPALYIAAAERENQYKIKFPGLTANKNIRVGGLVKIGGSYHLISEKPNSGDTVSIIPECATSFKEAEFIYGMSVDHNGESMNNMGNLSGDDGDGMVESYSKAGSDYIWTATFKSTHIPDGPIEMHVVVFDKAGNSRHSSVSTKVTNNPPRITSVKLSTDLNGNGSYDANESKTFYAFFKEDGTTGDTSKGLGVWTLDTAAYSGSSSIWTVKNGLQVEPEFVGGTSPYKYKFSKNAAHLDKAEKLTASELTTAALTAPNPSEPNKGRITLSNTDIGTTGEDTDIYFRFSFWDSTEETTAGDSSQWTLLNAKLCQNIADNIAPTAVINPFYWVSSEDNSLYYNKKDNGHIELEKDWEASAGYTSSTTPAALKDKDPKVSGKIVVRGSVSDDVRLGKIKMAFEGVFGDTELAEYNTSTGTWTYAASLPSGVLGFTVKNDSLTQSGHTADWELSVDTAKMAGVTGTNKKITVTAIHAATTTPNSSTPGTTQTTAKPGDTSPKPAGTTGYYQVDVVPYITHIGTKIGAIKDDFSRSATGWYSVMENETLKLYGFNLVTGTGNVKLTGAVANATTGGTDPKLGDYVNVNIGNTLTSGNISIVTNGIETLNNKNANPTFVSDTDNTITNYAYNSQPNNKVSERYTDDVGLYVWNKDFFLNKKDITSPMLKMDSASKYYMSYGYQISPLMVNKNGTERRVDYSYNKFHNTNVAFDGNGNLYAVATNTDRIYNDSARFVFYTPVSYDMPELAATQTWEYYTNSNSKRHLEMAYNKDTGKYDINRVKRPKLATCTKGSTTYIALVYYDYNNDANPIKFRFGSKNGTSHSGSIFSSLPTAPRNDNPPNTTSSGYHTIADKNSTAAKGGEYVSAGIVPVTVSTDSPDGVVAVVAWYDATAQKIMYSYNKNPMDNSESQWQTNAKVLDTTENTGWYVDLCVDNAGGIHVAYYDSARGDLKYAYLDNYKALDSGAVTTVTVDSYQSVGTNITVNTRLEGGKYVPYIYYYNASAAQTKNSIKVAWRKDMTTLRDGAIDELFTDAWESMIVPTDNFPVDATVCGGVPTSGTYADKVVLGYMSDKYYEKAVLKK